MKYLIAGFFILIAQLGYCQTDTNVVDLNKNKIDQLNLRLDNLLNGDVEGEVDSTNFKLDYIFQEIKKIKVELGEIKESINQVKMADNSTQSEVGRVNQIPKNQEVKPVAFYVVLASDRTKEMAEKSMERLKVEHNVILVRNLKDTWFHIIIADELSEKQAVVSTSNLRKKGFADAWWTTGKKLIQ